MTGHGTPTEDTISFADVVALFFRNLRPILIAPPAFAVVVCILFSILRNYSADSSFVLIRSGPNLGRVSGLAMQLGFGGSAIAQTEPVELYVTLLKSRHVLREAVLAKYTVNDDPEVPAPPQMTLLDIWDVTAPTEDERIAIAAKKLDGHVSASSNVMSGVITVRTKARTPLLAEQLNRKLLDLVDEYNVGRRIEQASLERHFVQDRLAETRDSLLRAEDDYQRFLAENRTFASSPQLLFEAGRLQRRVELSQQLYVSLVQVFEQARLEEVRNTPVISIVNPPEGSAMPSLRLLVVLFASGAMGLGITISTIFVREYIRREGARHQEKRTSGQVQFGHR